MKYKISTWGKLVSRATILERGTASDIALLPCLNAMNKPKQMSGGAPFKRSPWTLKGAKHGERQNSRLRKTGANSEAGCSNAKPREKAARQRAREKAARLKARAQSARKASAAAASQSLRSTTTATARATGLTVEVDGRHMTIQAVENLQTAARREGRLIRGRGRFNDTGGGGNIGSPSDGSATSVALTTTWHCAAQEMCGMKNAPMTEKDTHKCAKCLMRVHGIMCIVAPTEDEEGSGPKYCLKCNRPGTQGTTTSSSLGTSSMPPAPPKKKARREDKNVNCCRMYCTETVFVRNYCHDPSDGKYYYCSRGCETVANTRER